MNLRTCKDQEILRKLEELLQRCYQETGQEHVIVPWTTPPYGMIVGYGIYQKLEAEKIREMLKKSRGVPRFGPSYSVGLIHSLGASAIF